MKAKLNFLLCLFIGFLLFSACRDPEVDHYLVYKADPDTATETSVNYTNQFIKPSEPLIKLNKIEYFGVPADKRREGKTETIYNKSLHYTWHKIDPVNPKIRLIEANNQFYPEPIEFKTSNIAYLLSPATKIHLDEEDKKKSIPNAPHYICYSIGQNEFPDAPFDPFFAIDQFQEYQVIMNQRPTYFCVPSVKIHDQDRYSFQIDTEEDHLLFYPLEKVSIQEKTVLSQDQFSNRKNLNGWTLKLKSVDLFGVPTKKIGFKEE